jgi:hypothetical protein
MKARNKNNHENKSNSKFKKNLFTVAVAVLLISVISLGILIFSIVRKLDVVPNGKFHSDVDGLTLDIVSVNNDGKSPRITIRWSNESGSSVTPYPSYYIEKWNGEEWVSAEAPDTETSYPDETFSIPTGSMEFIEYSTAAATLERGGRYRLRTWCVSGVSMARVWAEFNVE